MFIQNRLGMLESVETMLAQEQRLNQVTNNLANVDTPGYKKDNVTFDEMLYRANQNRQRVGKALRSNTIHEQGVIQKTDNPMDIAITGEGFFKIQTPHGIRYTRAGNFQLDNSGQLVNASGYPVVGDGGPITIEGKSMDVTGDGRLFVDGQQVNILTIVTSDDQKDFEKEGENLFRLKNNAQELPSPEASLQQGFLEKSNVNTVTEMTAMIDLYRAYEGQQKAIRAIDDLDDLAVRKVGSLA